MAKDPAFLMYYMKWLASTAGWDADVRGWYINLLCHQADKPEGLPNDMETLADLAGVKVSQYNRFLECWKRTLEAQFKENEEGLLTNRTMQGVIDERKDYKNKQSKRGTVGYFIKKNRGVHSFTPEEWQRLSQSMVTAIIPIEDEKEIQQCLKRMLEAFIKDKDSNKDSVSDLGKDETSSETPKEGGMGETEIPPPPNNPQSFGGLLTRMHRHWVDAFPNYTPDHGKDTTALLNIAVFIEKQARVDKVANASDHELIFDTFKHVASHIKTDNEWWSDKPLNVISKNMQTFYNSIKSGKNGKTAATNRLKRTANFPSATAEGVQEVLSRRLGEQR